MSTKTSSRNGTATVQHGVARTLSKLGMASRSVATGWVLEGLVKVNGRVVKDPEHPVRQGVDRVEVQGRQQAPAAPCVVMLNKPRGLVTTAKDEQGRDTVYRCLDGSGLPWLAPVGRLDKASEGLLLFSNTPEWAARLTNEHGLEKTYHVHINRIPDQAFLHALQVGVEDKGEWLGACQAQLLRTGGKNAWLEIVLDEGKNRHIRRMLEVLGAQVLRLMRVAIGPLVLGDLQKGKWRQLTAAEVAALS